MDFYLIICGLHLYICYNLWFLFTFLQRRFCAKNILQMEWSNAKVMKFLELYQMNPCIWDPKHQFHKVKSKVNDAWEDIRTNMGEPECTVKELKKKKESLMARYRKLKNSQLSCADASQIFNSSWFAYKIMDTFLSGVYKCSPSMQMEESNEYNNEQNTEQVDDSNTVCEDESLTLEEEQPAYSTYQVSQQTSTIMRKRRRNPLEHQLPKSQMEQTYNILQNVAQAKNDEEDDECSIFGKLIAKKLSKISEDHRDIMMIKISQLLYDGRMERDGNKQSLPSIQAPTSPLPAAQIHQENTITQVTSKQPQSVLPVKATCKQETTDFNNFGFLNFDLNHTAQSNLNNFLIFRPKQ